MEPEAVTCTTPSHLEGDVQVTVTSNGVVFPSSAYSYSTSDTPTVTGVQPASAYSGETVTISGEWLPTYD